MHLPRIIKVIERFTIDNSPMILTALGTAGSITSAILAGKASYKAAELIAEEQKSRLPVDLITDTSDAELTRMEKVKLVWPLYIPAVANLSMTVTCIILANRIGTKRAAAMAAAYTISEKAFDEYRDKIAERLGATKEREAREDIAQEHIRANPVQNQQVIVTGGGEVLCYDEYTGRYFNSSMAAILKAVNDINHSVINHGFATLNEFYNRIGIPNAAVGEEVGWNTDALLEPMITATVSEDDRPCLHVAFHVKPARNGWRAY